MVKTVGKPDTTETVERKSILFRVKSRVLSDGNLTKKASLNAAASLIDQGVRTIIKLAINPFLLTSLGDSLFGTWNVLQSLIGQATPATGRPGEALKWTVAHDQASTNQEEKRRSVGSAVAVWLLFLPLLIPLGGALAWFSPVWLDLPSSSYATVRLTAAILLLNIVIAGLALLPQAVLHGENLAYKRLGLSTSVVVFANLFVVVAVYLRAGIVGMAVAATTTTLLTGGVYMYIASSRIEWFGIVRPSRADVRGFAGLSGWFLVWNFVMQLMRGGDIVVLGVAGSPVLATTYALARYLPQTITLASAMVIVAIMPGLGGLIGAGDLQRVARVRNETTTIIWLITTVAGATVLLWEESFLRLWVGAQYYPGTGEMLAIMALVLQFALIRTDSNIIDLTLKIRRKVLLGAMSTGLSVGLGWFLLSVLDMGIVGLVVGFIAGRAILSLGYPAMVGNLVGFPLHLQLKAIVRPGAATAFLFLCATVLSNALDVSSWIQLGVSAAVSAPVIGVFAFFTGLSSRSRRFVQNRILRAVRRT